MVDELKKISDKNPKQLLRWLKTLETALGQFTPVQPLCWR